MTKHRWIGARQELRLINFLIDGVLSNIAAKVIAYAFWKYGPPIIVGVDVLFVYLWAIVSYYTVFEYYFQKTPAKFLTHTRVIADLGSKDNGYRLTKTQAIKRTICRLIPFELFSGIYNYSWWHDRFSQTSVVTDAEFIRNTADETSPVVL